MFSFTWLFRLWSKNHSNFNRLWISPTFFYCRKRFAIDFRQLAFRHPKRNAADCLIRELLENGMDAAKHQHHSGLSFLQTDKLSRVCLFLSNLVCEDLYSELCLFYPASGFSENHKIFCDLYRQTDLHTMNAEMNPVFEIFDLLQKLLYSNRPKNADKVVLLLHSHA